MPSVSVSMVGLGLCRMFLPIITSVPPPRVFASLLLAITRLTRTGVADIRFLIFEGVFNSAAAFTGEAVDGSFKLLLLLP